jgi:hypothetical protein
MNEDWDRVLPRGEPACTSCEQPFPAGGEVIATLHLGTEGFRRRDLCPACFDPEEEGLFSHWRLRREVERRRPLQRLDLSYLADLFRRLVTRDDEHSSRLRWIVTLLLLRKKILVRQGRRVEAGHEVLTVCFRREEDGLDVVDPGLDSGSLATLHEDLARIFDLDQEAPAGQAAPTADERAGE